MNETKAALEERKVKRNTGEDSDSYEEYKSDEEIVIDDDIAGRTNANFQSVTVSKESGQKAAEVPSRSEKTAAEKEADAKPESVVKKVKKVKKKVKQVIDGEGEPPEKTVKKKKVKKTKEIKKESEELEQKDEEKQHVTQAEVKTAEKESKIEITVEANEAETIRLERIEDEQEKKREAEKTEELKRIEEPKEQSADKIKKFVEEKIEHILTADISQQKDTSLVNQVEEAEANSEILPSRETHLQPSLDKPSATDTADEVRSEEPIATTIAEEARQVQVAPKKEDAQTDATATATTAQSVETHKEEPNLEVQVAAAAAAQSDASDQSSHKNAVPRIAGSPEPSAEKESTEISEAEHDLSKSSDAPCLEIKVAQSESGSHTGEMETEEKSKGLPRGVNEILEHARKVAAENTSICSSRVLMARNLISRQEKLREQLMSIRHQFGDIDSEIRAFMNETYASQSRPTTKKY